MNFDVVYLPLCVLWGLGLIFFLFRRGVETVWKLCALLIFAFYVLWFYDNLSVSRAAFAARPGAAAAYCFQMLGRVIGLSLLVTWPVMLWRAYFAPSVAISSSITRNLALATLFFWMFLFLDYFTPPFVEPAVDWLAAMLGKVGGALAAPPTK